MCSPLSLCHHHPQILIVNGQKNLVALVCNSRYLRLLHNWGDLWFPKKKNKEKPSNLSVNIYIRSRVTASRYYSAPCILLTKINFPTYIIATFFCSQVSSASTVLKQLVNFKSNKMAAKLILALVVAIVVVAQCNSQPHKNILVIKKTPSGFFFV